MTDKEWKLDLILLCFLAGCAFCTQTTSVGDTNNLVWFYQAREMGGGDSCPWRKEKQVIQEEK